MTEAVGLGASVAFLAAVMNLLNGRLTLSVRVAILGAVIVGIVVAIWATAPSGQPF